MWSEEWAGSGASTDRLNNTEAWTGVVTLTGFVIWSKECDEGRGEAESDERLQLFVTEGAGRSTASAECWERTRHGELGRRVAENQGAFEILHHEDKTAGELEREAM